MADALVVNAVLLLCVAITCWLISLASDRVSFVDSIWGGAMAALAVASFVQTGQSGDFALALLGMTVIWGVRLFYHLLSRFLRNGEDERYVNMLANARAKERWGITVLFKVWLLQSVLLFAVSSPAQVGILSASGEAVFPWLGYAGIALWSVGLFFECVGDWQLARFKANPANAGKVMDRGLWRYTRHPNYFGDACVWWGIWLVAMAVAPAAVIWTLPGPIFLTFTLVKWSGAALTERGMREKYGEAFASYAQRTSAFIPWPPRTDG